MSLALMDKNHPDARSLDKKKVLRQEELSLKR